MLPESVFPGNLVAGGEGGDLDLEVLLHEDLGVCVLLGEEALGCAGAGAVPCVPVHHQAPGSEDAASGHRVPLPDNRHESSSLNQDRLRGLSEKEGLKAIQVSQNQTKEDKTLFKMDQDESINNRMEQNKTPCPPW